MDQIRLVAIGGGGFSQNTDAAMETALLQWAGPSCTRIGFIGSASANDPEKLARFYARFGTSGYHADHCPLDVDASEALHWVERQDLVYIGGGNALTLLNHWRACGLDAVLVDQARRGKPIAGVSAGANIWFEQALSDARGQGLSPLEGLGLVPGSFCAHYDQEADRPRLFQSLIGDGTLKAGYGLDDGVAVHFSARGFERLVYARPGAGAHFVHPTGASDQKTQS